MQLYVDLDGVLADFSRAYERAFGVTLRPAENGEFLDPVDWDRIAAYPNFFYTMPSTPDMPALWARISRYKPIILTGAPVNVVPDAADQKRAWVRAYLPGTLVLCCASSEKAQQCRPGDVLIDDWERHRPAWEAAGGIWITHRSATETDRALTAIGL